MFEARRKLEVWCAQSASCLIVASLLCALRLASYFVHSASLFTCLVLSCLVPRTSCLVLSRLVLSCLVPRTSCLVLSRLVLSRLVPRASNIVPRINGSRILNIVLVLCLKYQYLSSTILVLTRLLVCLSL